MTVNIYDPSQDSGQIRGFTIVVDVFRAFSTAYHINECKPDKYIVTHDIAHSLSLRNNNENIILIGERGGIRIEGFDFGNSPTEITGQDFTGKTVVHNTTAGTRGIMCQPRDNTVVAGSFVNSSALLSYINAKNISTVNIYCTAPKGDAYGEEDYIFADYFKAKLLDRQTDFASIVTKLRLGSGRGFKKGGFAPYTDFLHCMDINRFDLILTRKIDKSLDRQVEFEVLV